MEIRKEIKETKEGIGFLLALASRKMRRLFARRLKDLELAPQQYAILRILFHEGTCSPNQLSSIMGIERAVISRHLDRMEKKELLRRETNMRDRRSITLKLTKRGQSISKHLPNISETVINEVLAGISKEELKILSDLLVRIVENSEAASVD